MSHAGFKKDELQPHGLATQDFFHPSDINVYGVSNDGFSPERTELGLNLSYHPLNRLTFSAQYNAENLGLTAEFIYQWGSSKDYNLMPNFRTITESWYVQGSYRFIPQVQGIICYDMISVDTNDRAGTCFADFELLTHLAYVKDWVVRTEFYRVQGVTWIAEADNQIRSKTRQGWNLYAL